MKQHTLTLYTPSFINVDYQVWFNPAKMFPVVEILVNRLFGVKHSNRIASYGRDIFVRMSSWWPLNDSIHGFSRGF